MARSVTGPILSGARRADQFCLLVLHAKRGAVSVDNGKIYVTITMMVDIREYQDPSGRSPFREWFDKLNAEASRKVTTALYRMGIGNFANVKGVGAGVYECRIHFGPGYRVYFGKDGERIVILLGGGTKKRQPNDIKFALERWQDYKQRKREQKDEE